MHALDVGRLEETALKEEYTKAATQNEKMTKAMQLGNANPSELCIKTYCRKGPNWSKGSLWSTLRQCGVWTIYYQTEPKAWACGAHRPLCWRMARPFLDTCLPGI